jgi:hypothetical protein
MILYDMPDLLVARGTGVSSPGERKSFRNLLTFVHI